MLDLFMQLSAFLGVWLLVGFSVGLKIIVLERRFTEKNRKNLTIERRKLNDGETDEEIRDALDRLINNNKISFISLTLCGFYSFYADTVGTFKRRK